MGAIWRLALPMSSAMLLQNAFSLTDMFFVGKLGPNAIAALAACGVLIGLIFTLAVGVIMGCTALVAQAIGGRDKESAQVVTGQSMVIALLLSVIVAGVAIPAAPMLLRLVGTSPPVTKLGVPYLQITAAFAPVLFIGVALSAAVRGAGDAMTPLKVIGCSNVINIILDPILIFGWLGAPALGVAGSALASSLARLIGFVLLAWIFFGGGHETFHLRPRHLRPNLTVIGRIIKIGVFSSGQMLARNISAVALVRIISIFGPVPLAVYGIGIRIFTAVLLPGFGFGNAAATLIGQNLGADSTKRATQAGWTATWLWTSISTLIAIVLFIFAKDIITVFNAQPEVVAAGSIMLRWISVSIPFTAISVVISQGMGGAGDTMWPMLIVGFSMILARIPLAYGLSARWDSAGGVWVAWTVSIVLEAMLFVLVFLWGRWKKVGRRFIETSNESN